MAPQNVDLSPEIFFFFFFFVNCTHYSFSPGPVCRAMSGATGTHVRSQDSKNATLMTYSRRVTVFASYIASVTQWVPLISIGLFALSGCKHQRKQTQAQIQTLGVNGHLRFVSTEQQ